MGHTKFTNTELEATMPKRGPISSSTYATVNSSQYRNSYPPSRRGCHGHPQWDEPHDSNGQKSVRRVPEFSDVSIQSVQNEAPSRPRRSSLRQPQDFNLDRRRKSISAKRVHFSRAEMVYEPFGPQDVQTVDQILDLLRIPSRKIPYTSSHSVTLRLSEAAHDYPEPIVSSRERIRNARPLSAELVEGPATSGSPKYGYQSEVQTRDQYQPKLKSRRSSRHHLGALHPQLCADEVDQREPGGDSQVDTRSEGQKLNPRSTPYCQARPRSHTEARSKIDSHYRPHSHVSEHVENAAPARKRSSISSDETLINPDANWARASKVMSLKHQGRSESAVDADKPIVNQAEDKILLHRSDAQRLPKVPRRHKLLRNLAKMFE